MGFWKRTGDIGVASRRVRLHCDDNGDDPVWTMLITSIMNRTLPSRTMIPGLFAAIIGLGFVIVPSALSSEFSSTFAYANPLVGGALGWILLGELPKTAACLGMAESRANSRYPFLGRILL